MVLSVRNLSRDLGRLGTMRRKQHRSAAQASWSAPVPWRFSFNRCPNRTKIQSARGLCCLHASFVRRGGDSVAKSSVRSAMFIATRAAQSAKLRRSGMCLCPLGYCGGFLWGHGQHSCRSYGAWLDGRVVVTINMMLLTELDRFPPPKMRVKCGGDWRAPKAGSLIRFMRWYISAG